ncbi:MAG: tRNA (adenosine(37)-N6)-threonylcarbamoyltransferase complex ATPase subunit type 1 TsaE, partial [Solirubrobacterales bacterium]|nr:tRNA (adenosine(37)-N6)-threonylcarbamoyltransferase complex ATPase subunit type 1 TsaE [Solirubrobacterales bacterium]
MDLPFQTVTHGPVETEALGASFASQLKAGDCVMIEGDLGAGKTVFVRGCLRSLGVTGPVTSPTFTLAKRYDEAQIPASHIDLYRLADGMPGEDP